MNPGPFTKGGQAAVELAVFGAVLIFILGTIVRSAVGNGYAQNENFKAMRMALLSSWQGSEANRGTGAQNVSRNSASVLFVEDRLSPDFNKYGDLDRNPFIAQGAGTMSYNMLYPVDQSEVGTNVPIMDVWINGQHFPFTTAAYTSTTLTQPSACTFASGGPFDPPTDGGAAPLTPQQCMQNQCLRQQREWSGGTKIFFTRVPNANAPVDNGSISYTFASCGGNFDLMRNNDGNTVALVLQPYMAWQWCSVNATNAATIGLDPDNNQYPTYDIDGRLKEVTVYGLSGSTVTYEDYQGGDIDTTWDGDSCTPKPGLQSNSQVYTFTQNGTYLEIKEGQLYNPETDLYVRSANKRNTIDLIQRSIQLSNNTGRFCDPNGNVLGTVGNDGVTPNPVEVCIAPGSASNCFSSENNIKSTCYDENDNMIFVRSRLEDRRGHFWMTDASGQLQVQ